MDVKRIWCERLLDGTVAVKENTRDMEIMESEDEMGALLHNSAFMTNSGGVVIEKFSVLNWFLNQDEIIFKYSEAGFKLNQPTIRNSFGQHFYHLRIAERKAQNKLDSLKPDSVQYTAWQEFYNQLKLKVEESQLDLENNKNTIDFLKTLTFDHFKPVEGKQLGSDLDESNTSQRSIFELHKIGIKEYGVRKPKPKLIVVVVVTWFGEFYKSNIGEGVISEESKYGLSSAMANLLKFWDSKDEYDGFRVSPLTLERRIRSGTVSIKGEYMCGNEILGIDEDYDLESWYREKDKLAEVLCLPNGFNIEDKVVFDAEYSTRHIGPMLGMTKKRIKEAHEIDSENQVEALKYHLKILEDKYWIVKKREQQGVITPFPGAKYLNRGWLDDDVDLEQILDKLDKLNHKGA